MDTINEVGSNEVIPLSLNHVADISYQFMTSLLRNLNQSDLEALVTANPTFGDLIYDLPRTRFPLVQQLHFLNSTSNPICVRKLYENVRVATNLPSTHPVAEAMLNNSQYLSNVTIGIVDIDNLDGTLVGELLKRPLELGSFTIETITFNPHRLFRRAVKFIPAPVLVTQDLIIGAFSLQVRDRHYFAQCWAIAAFLNSMKMIGKCQVPNQLVTFSHPMFLLLDDAKNVNHFSLLNSTMNAVNLREVVRYASPIKRKLISVPFRATEALNLNELESLLGETIATIPAVELMDGVPFDPKTRIIIQSASALQVNIDNGRYMIDASFNLQPSHRSIVLTSLYNTFPVNGLKRFSPAFTSIRSIFDTFGQIDVLDLRHCQLPSEYGTRAFERFYFAKISELLI